MLKFNILTKAFLPCLLLPGRLAAFAVEDATNSDALPREQIEFFENHIRPVLVERCYECHSTQAEKIKGGLLLDFREGWMKGGDSGPAIIPGDPEKSLVIRAIRYSDEDLQMPPKKKGPLTEKQVNDFVAWIKMGVPDPRQQSKKARQKIEARADARFWSFQPLKQHPLPEVKNTNWVKNPIDNFILAQLERHHLVPAPPAGKRTLARRVYFDLIGLPPTPAQLEKFVNDPSPRAYAQLVEELLASKHYGERWARHWLDVARYADSGGYETDIYFRNAWRYRDYVVKSLNEDKPYDRFVQEQIAGDELWPDNLDLDGSYEIPESKLKHLEARIGTGLYTLGPQVHESNMDAPKLNYERLTDWADTTGAVFLGLTLGCARCHDHKFDPISQRDYYSLQAIFAGSKEVEIPLITGMGIADFKQHYPKIVSVVEARRAYRLYDEKVKGKQLTPEEKQEKQRLLENVAQAALALPEATAHDGPFDGLMEIPTATVLGHERPELIPAIHILNRGDLKNPKDKVGPDLPAVIRQASGWNDPISGPFGSRKQLALWITNPKNPLPARVMANRIWHWHFGRGIVATPNDFGKMGEPPTHPELLDWLANEFIAQGWSLKKLHRLIVLSATYQMDSRFSTENNSRVDPENRFLWRMNRRRLEAEALWDSMHAVAGTLNPAMGGRPVVPPLGQDETAPGAWIVSADPSEHNRRGIYILMRRNFRFPMFDVFDSPVNAVSSATRDVTTVAPQALWLLNNKTAFLQAQSFAARLVRSEVDSATFSFSVVRQSLTMALAAATSAPAPARASFLRRGSHWNQPDFGPGQTGWAGSKAGAFSGWAKRIDNGNPTPTFDDPIGTVLTHGPTSVLWKAPPNDPGGVASLSGGLWNVRHLGRSGTWKLWKNDTMLLSEGALDDSSGASSNPVDLSRGNGGAAALLKIAYQAGDSFRLEIIEGDFVGVNFKISAGQNHDLAGDFTLDSNPTPNGWQYSESLSNGGDIVGPALLGLDQVESGPSQWIDNAWLIGLGRPPSEEEKRESAQLIEMLAQYESATKAPENTSGPRAREQAALVKLCLAIFNLNEFTYID